MNSSHEAKQIVLEAGVGADSALPVSGVGKNRVTRIMSEHSRRWLAAIEKSGQPAYLAIADAIADDMRSGQLTAGARLPALRELATQLHLNFTTVARAYAEAQRRGLIDSRTGQGSFVRNVLPPNFGRPRGFSDLLAMTMNLPPEPRDAALMERMHQGITEVYARAELRELLRYQEFGGSVEDRQAGVIWLHQRLPRLDIDRVLVCPGAQSALLGLMSVLARPGDLVCCEALTYSGIKAIAAQLGVRLHGLPTDAEGIDPQAFAAACGAFQPKALYCNPTLQNPTTATISQRRREALAEVALRFGVPIIEDDAYGMLPKETPTTFAQLAPELTFHISGLAKCVGAGLRIAYLVAPDERQTKRLLAPMRGMMVMASPFNSALATHWINDGTATAALEAIRKASHVRQADAARLLPAGSYASHADAFHLWLNLPAPWTSASFTSYLRGQGVGVVGSDAFTVAGSPAPEAVRVCLGGAADRMDFRHMVELIAEALALDPITAGREPGALA
jgi:DNA-binding transcriptional MocR family regulator